MDDPYQVLGVDRSADEAAIRAAFRRLAKKHHPDLNPDNKEAEARFKAINAAYSLLSDPAQRARFDRGEIDATGAEKPPERPFYRDFGDQTGRRKYRAAEGNYSAEDLEDILRAFGGGAGAGFGGGFGAGGFGGFRSAPQPGPDVHYTINLSFLDAVNGTKRRVTMPDGRTLDVNVPAGMEDGGILRLRGQGGAGYEGGQPGDALVEVSIQPHPYFKREGDDIIVEVPITLKEAVLGEKITVPTIKGSVALAIPPYSSSGKRLRLKGRGVRQGHQYVELRIVLPAEPDASLTAAIEAWTPAKTQNPRANLEEA